MKLKNFIAENKKIIFLVVLILVIACIGWYLCGWKNYRRGEIRLTSIEVAGGGNVYVRHIYK